MGIQSFKASDGWLWRMRNHHGIGNKVERGGSGSADYRTIGCNGHPLSPISSLMRELSVYVYITYVVFHSLKKLLK